MTQKGFSIQEPLKEEEILILLKKSKKKGYCVLWYMKGDKNAFTYTIYNSKNEAKTKIKENKELFNFIHKTKIIEL